MGFEWGSFFTGTGDGIREGGTTLGTAMMEAPQRKANLKKTQLGNEKEEEEKKARERKSAKMEDYKKLLLPGAKVKTGKTLKVDTGMKNVKGTLHEPEPPTFEPVMEEVPQERDVLLEDQNAAAYDVSPEFGTANRRLDISKLDVQGKSQRAAETLKQRYIAMDNTKDHQEMQNTLRLMEIDRKKMHDRFLAGKGTKDTEIREYGMLLRGQRDAIINGMIKLSDMGDADPAVMAELKTKLAQIDADLQDAISIRTTSIKDSPIAGGESSEFGFLDDGSDTPGMGLDEAAGEIKRLKTGGPAPARPVAPPNQDSLVPQADLQTEEKARAFKLYNKHKNSQDPKKSQMAQRLAAKYGF